MHKNSQKNIFGFARKKIAQNPLRFMRKNCAKIRKKKICAKIAQILRKKYSHFVETLDWRCNYKWPISINQYKKGASAQFTALSRIWSITWKIETFIDNNLNKWWCILYEKTFKAHGLYKLNVQDRDRFTGVYLNVCAPRKQNKFILLKSSFIYPPVCPKGSIPMLK